MRGFGEGEEDGGGGEVVGWWIVEEGVSVQGFYLLEGRWRDGVRGGGRGKGGRYWGGGWFQGPSMPLSCRR